MVELCSDRDNLRKLDIQFDHPAFELTHRTLISFLWISYPISHALRCIFRSFKGAAERSLDTLRILEPELVYRRLRKWNTKEEVLVVRGRMQARDSAIFHGYYWSGCNRTRDSGKGTGKRGGEQFQE